MRLVMIATFSDGYTYTATEHTPLEAESVEHAFVAFCDAYKNASDYTFKFGDREYCTSDFECEGKFYPPDFYTLDEWFADCAKIA